MHCKSNDTNQHAVARRNINCLGIGVRGELVTHVMSAKLYSVSQMLAIEKEYRVAWVLKEEKKMVDL